MINSMLSYSGLSQRFWGEAMLTACYLLNRVPNKMNRNTPYKLWTKKKPNLNYLKVWGCRAAVRLPDPKLKTLGERGIECIFVGYAEHSKAFRFYVIETNYSVAINSIIESRDAIFDEHKFSSVPRPSQRSLVKGTEDSGGIDYFDTYALVARISTIRSLIAMASIHNLIIHQMDVKTAFLNEELEEEVYMNQPLGFIMPGNENKVCKLIKSLYGLKQAPEQWHQNFDEVVLSNGYLLNQADKCVYSKFDTSGKGFIICLYVDDMLIFGTDQVQVDLTKEFLSSRFSMKYMGEVDVILGIRINHESKGIAISQSYYIEKVLKKFNYSDCTPISTPLDTYEKMMPNRGLAVSQLEYSRVIGCLMYAMTCTRPDIAFAVGKLSRYTSNPGTQHWQEIQRVLKYLKKTIDCRLVYSGYPLVLKGYTDASCISNTEDNSSTSGWVFLLGEAMESKFVALEAAGKEAEWLKNLLLDIPLWVKPMAPISVRSDIAATLAKAYSQMYNGKSRHLGVIHSMIRELITNGVVYIEFVRSQQNLVDHLMKGLARDLVIKSAERAEAHVLQIIPRMCLEPAWNLLGFAASGIIDFGSYNIYELDMDTWRKYPQCVSSSEVVSVLNYQRDFIKVPNPFDVVCAKKKLAENERPILKQTADVVTLPSDHVVNLALVPLNQVIPAIALPPPANVKKRSSALAPAGESALKKGRAEEFILGISTTAPKRLVDKGKRPSAHRNPLSKKGQLVICPPKSVMEESAADSSHEATDDLSPMSHHIPSIIFDSVEDLAETPHEDRFYSSMSVDPSLAKDIYLPDWELTNDFIMDKRPLCCSFIDHLATPGQFSCLRLEHVELPRSKLKRRLARHDAALEKRDAEIARLQKLVNEKPSAKMAWLRLGFEGAERKVMAISIISISSDSSEDSMGTPAGRVILFGTIPTTIPDTTSMITPPTTNTPIIAPTIPPSPDYTPSSPDYSPASEAESDPFEDPSSGHIPPLPAISPFLSSDDDTADSDTPDTPLSPTHDTPFTEITTSTQRSHVIPRRRVMILAPGQPIPHGRSYRYHPNGPVHMMTERKRVKPTSAGPSHKRRRSPMTSVPALPLISGALSHVRDDLIPPPKRVRDICYLADVEVDPREARVERVAHPAMPEDILEPAQEGAAEVTYETLGDLVQRFHDHTYAILVHRIQTTEDIQREQGCKIVRVESAVTALTERIVELERNNQRLRGTASVESQIVDRLQRDMSRMQREMRQMRQF
nr:zinc finger, CCHC-type [Tanacetum cinerariifolium]